MKRRVHKRDMYRESGWLRTEHGGLMEDGLGALGVSWYNKRLMGAPIIVRNCNHLCAVHESDIVRCQRIKVVPRIIPPSLS